MIDMMREKHLFFPAYVDLPDAQIYTMFFPSQKKNAPVLIYNPGGPGGSAVEQILRQYSPYVYRDGKIMKNTGDMDLTLMFSLLYLDIPAGTGYSIAKKKIQYGDKNTVSTAVSVIQILLRYYKEYVGINPTLDFFGFSYAGKILPLIARDLYDQGYKIGGIVLFSGYTDPILQEIRPIMEYLLYNGLISSSEYSSLEDITNQIEKMLLLKQKDWKEIQKIYIDTLSSAWDIAQTDTYNIQNTIYRETILESIDVSMDNVDVKRSLGAKGVYNADASSFEIATYEGFLSSASSSLKYLSDREVLLLYMMGTLDGATLAKGTKDMMEQIYHVSLKGDKWMIGDIHIGRLSKINKNVYIGIVIGTGHSFDTKEGVIAFSTCLKYLHEYTA